MDSIRSAPRSLIIALDIGTHASGFSWVKGVTVDGRPRNIVSQHESWPDQPVPYPKARSAILYHGSRPIEWGWTAGKKYASLSALEAQSYTYLEDFKLGLQDATHASALGSRLTPEQDILFRDIPTDCLIDPCISASVSASLKDVEDVIYFVTAHWEHQESQHLLLTNDRTQVMTDFLTLFIKYVKHTLQRHHCVSPLDFSSCQWCMTVPAMWTLDSKAKMRKAAYRAGLIRSLDSDQLMIILEPEAAALHAMETRAPPLHPGQTVAIVDVGGGTADVTVHNVKTVNGNKTVLAEAVAAHGELCGSQYVDKQFKEYFRSQVGSAAYDTWSAGHPDEVKAVMDRWTVCKHDFKGATHSSANVRIPLTANLLSHMSTLTKGMLARQQGLAWAGQLTSLTLSCSTIQGLFQPVVDQVIDVTLRQLRVAANVSTIILVGGFASSPYLQVKLKTAIHSTYPTAHVVVPDRPYAAVLLGAVLYGCSPSLIHSRRSKLSYGTKICTNDTVGAPRDSLFIHMEDQQVYSRAHFACFVQKGQSVEHDEEVTQSFTPLFSRGTQSRISIYATENTSARWVVTDGTFHELGEMTVKLSAAGGHNREIKVCFKFGATELVPTAWDPERGEKVQASFTFANDTV